MCVILLFEANLSAIYILSGREMSIITCLHPRQYCSETIDLTVLVLHLRGHSEARGWEMDVVVLRGVTCVLAALGRLVARACAREVLFYILV
jgi:hypothetical protein